MSDAPAKPRYAAFISYSHRDSAAAAWLHRALETYSAPEGFELPERLPTKGRRLAPIFKDREELSSSHDLTESIRESLAASHALIVICSPTAAASHWVNEEIKAFKQIHGEERIYALIVDGEDNGPEPFFPEALLQRIGADGEILEAPGEPLAADIRQGKDGKRLAKLKIAAGLLDVGLDRLVQRDAARERKQMMTITAGAVAVMLMMATLAVFAMVQRNVAQEQKLIAEQQSDTANAALDYLVSLFEIANPATENPKTITALTILERGREKIDAELGDKPVIRSKLLNAIGKVHMGLGNVQTAKPILAAAAKGPFASDEDRFLMLLDNAEALITLRELEEAEVLIDTAERALPPGEAGSAKNYWRTFLYERRASHAYYSSHPDQAIEHYRSALNECDFSNSNQLERCAKLSSSLGMILVQRKEFEDGRVQLYRARDLFTRLYGDGHLRVAIANNNLGFADFKSKNYEQALVHMKSATAKFESILEDDHPYLGEANLQLGRIYTESGRPNEAIEYITRSNQIFASAFGEMHPKVGFGSVFLSLALSDQGEHEQSFEALKRADQIYATNFAPDSFNAGDLLVHWALVYEQAGDTGAAHKKCEDGLSILLRIRSADDPYLKRFVEACDRIQTRHNSLENKVP